MIERFDICIDRGYHPRGDFVEAGVAEALYAELADLMTTLDNTD